MLRALLRLTVLLVVLLGGGALLLGWWSGGGWLQDSLGGRPVGTSGRTATEKAREAGAELGEKAATAAARAESALEDGRLTTKIKAKMALDDSVHAGNINVDTKNRAVTLSGHVSSEAERQRALQLARETAGVTSVVDHMKMSSPNR
jgi:hyperosmotically inducible periplasmic protein